MFRRTISIVLLTALPLVACGGRSEDGADPTLQGPTPRPDDPELEHTWTMSQDASIVKQADLGTTPPDAAAKLMAGGRMPSVTHRVAQVCAKSDSLSGLGAVALRFSIGADGKPTDISADPEAAGGKCFAEAFGREAGTFEGVTASAALLRIELHPKGSANKD
jgi:hypothetical protein